MADQSQIRQLQTPDNQINVYPITVEDAVFDSNGMVLSQKMATLQSDMATVEPSSTSAHAYAVGDYLMYNSQLYRVTQAISVGDTLTPGTNITAVKITDEMGSSGGSGGHTILNPSGTALTQRTNLQFKRSTVTDDPTNNRTIVTPEGSADFRNLNLTQSDLSASATYARYPYEYALAWTGATAGSFVKMQVANADSTEYALPYAAEPFTDSVKLYFSNALTAQVHVELYLLSTSEITDSALLANYYTKAQTDAITGDLTELETPRSDDLVDGVNSFVEQQEEDIYGVNLLKNQAISKTENGITFKVNADGSVTVNGTATADVTLPVSSRIKLQSNTSYTLSGCPTGGSFSTFDMLHNVTSTDSSADPSGFTPDSGNGSTFTTENTKLWYQASIRIRMNVTVSNLTFYPMLRKATITDPTYRPYNYQAIQNQLNDHTGVLGAKNLLPYPYVSKTITSNGITYTDNGDGSILINGTTGDSPSGYALTKDVTNNNFLENGRYILSSGGADLSSKVYIWINKYVSGSGKSLVGLFNDGEVEFTIDTSQYDGIKVGLYVGKNTTVSNLLVKPMLRLASDPDPTYVPYAMTNRELTEKIANLKTITANASDFAAFKTAIASL